MKRWQQLIRDARGMAHVVAAGTTLLFALPVGAYLVHRQIADDAEREALVTRHANLHVRMIEAALERTATATRLLADSLPARAPAQILAVGQSLIKVSGTITRLEISRDGHPPFIITRDHTLALNDRTIVPLLEANAGIGLMGAPVLAVRSGQLVVSQALAVQDGGPRPRFWGYAAAVVPFSNLATVSHLEDLQAEGYGVRLQHGQEGNEAKAVVFEQRFDPAAAGVTRSIPFVGSGHLRLDVQRIPPVLGGLAPITWGFYALGSVLFYLLSLRLLRRPAELEREVARRTRQLDNEKLALQREAGSRIQAERLLERSHRILDSIFEHFPGMLVLKRAGDLRVAMVNRSAEEILGRPREAVVGRSADELYDPELADRMTRGDYQAMIDRQVIELSPERIESAEKPERWLRFRKVVLPDRDGKPEYILEFGEDVTERERLDLRLREHLNFLEQLLDAIPAPLFFKDDKGRYIGANTAFERYLGKPRSEIIGKTVFDVSPGSLAYIYHRADCELLAAGGSQIYESRVRDADGVERDVMFHKAVFHATSGEAGGIVGMFLDISERKQAEQRIGQLNRMLTVLSQTNQAIVRIHERDALLAEVARLIRSDGGFPVAWIYLAGDAGVRIVADSGFGFDVGFAQRMTDALLASETCPSTRPLACDTVACCDAALAGDLAKQGLQSFVHMPLQSRDGHLGGIGILGTDRGALGDEEHEMLQKLADNVSFALDAFAEEARRKTAEGKLQLAACVFENSAEGLIVTDPANRILMVNRAFTQVTGYAADEVIGQTPALLSSGRQDPAFYKQMWKSLHERGEWRGEIENRRKNGEIYPEWLNISIVRDSAGELTNYVAVFSDLTARKEIEARVNFLAHYDALTSLPNRVLFTNRLEQFMAQARAGKRKLAVMFLDIDRFKLINDSVGHDAGDTLLLEVSNRLLACLPKGSDVSRLGGDEFAVILSGMDSPAAAATCASTIQHALRQQLRIEEHEIHLSVSIGISVFPDDADSVEALAAHADTARYAAAENGGNAYRFFQPEMNSRSAERMRLESRLHHALDRGELSVYFQPLIAARSGQIIGAEALLRWRHDEVDAFVSPATFVPLLEETGLIVGIGEWVMRIACQENQRWRDASGRELFVAVNLSAVQLADDALVDKVGAILREQRFDPRHLEIELTESAVMRDAQRGVRTMQQLKALGVSLSIDDFGTGYSSLSYLKQLPLDTLKIDRSFVIDAPTDPEAVSIIRAIIALGHSLHLEIIAEGVEHPAQVNFLRDNGADILQGYYFAQPLPAEQFMDLITGGPAYPVAAPQPALQLAPPPQPGKVAGALRSGGKG
ncbi:EAL and GGDEF domain-containing protein [Azospira restricta]|uniref:EAL domain-containing protein n=1 Tax=Azospira restricta TaxID=404405 RepID=A0A974SMF6_9RHOO|nr:EAL domain-containing protein [Azospira restricta]QRJ62407.1 EAL domain-containing protein [Azospira restricta]